MLERLAHVRTADAIVVATTTEASDDAIATLAARAGFACHRGHPTDLLDRHFQAARAASADVVVKIPSDCPLIDPAVVDRVVLAHAEGRGRFAYTSNLHPESYPDGSDVEVMTMEALAAAWREAERPHEREHTTPFLWDQPDRFPLHAVLWEAGRDVSRTHRVVVDYKEDYDVVRTVFEALNRPSGAPFTVTEIVAFLDAHPEVRLHNAAHLGTHWQTRQVVEWRRADRGSAKRLP